jgi:ribonuclease P protein component
MSESLRPQERIRKQSDFARIYEGGSRYRGRYFNLVYLTNDLNFSRMASVASKKVGNAVKRNKVKRWMRALFRRNKDMLNASFDLIMIAKPGMPDSTWNEIMDEYKKALQHLNKKSRAA